MKTGEQNRVRVEVHGIVQGVGFRPFVYNIARNFHLTGNVSNTSRGVEINIQGTAESINAFLHALRENGPPLARIDRIECHNHLTPAGYSDFRIVQSFVNEETLALISPDVATCEDCLKELFDPSDRRYRYPFLNCTNCGPRFTIIESVPYDRAKTTMKRFAMCEECEAEYNDSGNRRFHAQPNACPKCGPRLNLFDGSRIDAHGQEALAQAVQRLRDGAIVAIKGLGGFHLACDALNQTAVAALRRRKFREDKPFALMARDLPMILEHCDVATTEERLLLSPARPIVLLRRHADSIIAPAVSPSMKWMGFMLPYSPLHHLLLHDFNSPVVLTSGNISDEPIVFRDEEVTERLSGIADYFLLHDREIHMRCDDSVVRAVNEHPYIIRRSRGYAPEPITVSIPFENQILAVGAELKNTFCMTRGDNAFISHHIGDLENLQTLESFTEGIEHFRNLFDLNPQVVAYDLHPEYLSTKYALDLESIPVKIGIQHHHAHIASCMVDNGIEGNVIGIAMDGLGFGLDGNFWGGEFIVTALESFDRFAHLSYVPMPGGAKAIREPWRMAAAHLHLLYGQDFDRVPLDFNRRLQDRNWNTLRKTIDQQINAPLTSSMGRCFDAIASLIGIRDKIHYEGQAAIELEMIADESCRESYHFDWPPGERRINLSAVIIDIIDDLARGMAPSIISAKFHNAVAELILNASTRIRKETALRRVALSGGVFQNIFLLEKTIAILRSAEFDVFTHQRVPANDAGISLGQAAIADARMKRNKSLASGPFE